MTQTIISQIEQEFKGFNIIIKSKAAQKLVNNTGSKAEGFAFTTYHTGEYGVSSGQKFEHVIRVETFDNGNARVTVKRAYEL